MTIERVLNDLAEKCSRIPITDATQGVYGFLLGAIYSLKRSSQLKYQDRTGENLDSMRYICELKDIYVNISRGEDPNGQWLAGFYFNASLQRLAAIYDRAIRILMNAKEGKVHDLWQKAYSENRLDRKDYSELCCVYKEINKLKHEPAGLLPGRRINMKMALIATDQAHNLLRIINRSKKDNVG